MFKKTKQSNLFLFLLIIAATFGVSLSSQSALAYVFKGSIDGLEVGYSEPVIINGTAKNLFYGNVLKFDAEGHDVALGNLVKLQTGSIDKFIINPAGDVRSAGNICSVSAGKCLSDFASFSNYVPLAGGVNITGGLNIAGNVGIGTTAPTQKLHVEGQCVTGDTLLPILNSEEFLNFQNQKTISREMADGRYNEDNKENELGRFSVSGDKQKNKNNQRKSAENVEIDHNVHNGFILRNNILTYQATTEKNRPQTTIDQLNCSVNSGPIKSEAKNICPKSCEISANVCIVGKDNMYINHSTPEEFVKSYIKYTQIKDVRGGEYVLSLNEKTGRLEPAEIKGLLDMGVKPIYKLTTESGKTIRTTGNHPYLTRRENKKLFNLSWIVEKNNNKEREQDNNSNDLKNSIGHKNLLFDIFNNDDITYQNKKADYDISEKQIVHIFEGNISSPAINEIITKKMPTTNENKSKFLPENPGMNIVAKVEPINNLEISNRYSAIFSNCSFDNFDFISDKNCIHSRNDYNTAENDLSNVEWTKVAELSVGDEIAAIRESEVVFERIAKIEQLPPEQVYDIEVEGTHNFVANGIIAHNTYINGNTEIVGHIKIVDGAQGVGKVLTSDANGLATWGTIAGSPVTSVFARTGAITATAGDYDVTKITGAAPLNNPTFAGTVSGITAAMVGLGNVTNESKTTMFSSPTFTGNVTMPGTGIWNSLGNVGIGTTAPNKQLHIKTSAGNNAEIDIQSGTANHWGIYHDETTEDLRFWNVDPAGEDNVLTLGNDGNVGIGTVNPTAKLEVSGDVIINGLTVGRGSGAIASNTVIGAGAVQSNTTGYNNTVVGQSALTYNTTGNNNTVIGRNVFAGNITGNENIAIGDYSGVIRNDTGTSNENSNQSIFLGNSARSMTANGTNEIAIGYQAIGQGSNSVVLGNDLITKTILKGNVGIGTTAPAQELDLVGDLRLENTISNDTGVIYKGGDRFIHNFKHPTGGGAIPAGENIFIGVSAGNFTMGSTASENYQASYNSAIGYLALNANTLGYNNSAIGRFALRLNTSGSYNSAIGSSALNDNTTGSDNTAVGYNALDNNTTGENNTAVGHSSLGSSITGSNNTAIGKEAGKWMTDGNFITPSSSVFVGYNTRALGSSDTNEIVIGSGAVGAGSNTVVIGNDSITKTILKGNVGIGTTAPNGQLEVFRETGNDVAFRVNLPNVNANRYLQVSADGTNGNMILEARAITDRSVQNLLINPSGGNVGIGTIMPSAKLDVNGNVAVGRGQYTALAGENNNLDISGNSFIEISASNNYTITGIVNGTGGQILILYNNSSLNNMSIVNENASSTDVNRIHTLAGASLSTSGQGSITLIYSTYLTRWLVIGSQL